MLGCTLTHFLNHSPNHLSSVLAIISIPLTTVDYSIPSFRLSGFPFFAFY
jgi:hypothetical protein